MTRMIQQMMKGITSIEKVKVKAKAREMEMGNDTEINDILAYAAADQVDKPRPLVDYLASLVAILAFWE